jgi:hypothetical protein
MLVHAAQVDPAGSSDQASLAARELTNAIYKVMGEHLRSETAAIQKMPAC